MNHLFNLTKKELKELLAPGAILSILIMMIMFMSIGSLIGGEVDSATSPSKVGYADGDEGSEWSLFAIETIHAYYQYTYNISYEEATSFIIKLESPFGEKEEIMKEMSEKGVNTAFGIVPGFSDNINSGKQAKIEEYYLFTNSGLLGSATAAVSATIVPAISVSISAKLVSEITSPEEAAFLLNPIEPTTTHTYINGKIYDGVTPIEISTSIMSQTMMMPIVIMIIIVIIGGMVINSMGSEKENKTLETLLTMPVKRTTIVSGKLLAAAIVGLIYGIAYMLGMSFYIGGLTRSAGSISLQDYGLSLGILEWIIIAIMIFLAIFSALGLCMILGAFTKNMKSAQMMLMPITILAMIPMFITMFSSWGSLPLLAKGVVFAIPFSHPMMVMNNLMFGELNLVLAGLAYLLLFTLAIIFITVRLYKSDILITGLGQTKGVKMAKQVVTKRKT